MTINIVLTFQIITVALLVAVVSAAPQYPNPESSATVLRNELNFLGSGYNYAYVRNVIKILNDC